MSLSNVWEPDKTFVIVGSFFVGEPVIWLTAIFIVEKNESWSILFKDILDILLGKFKHSWNHSISDKFGPVIKCWSFGKVWMILLFKASDHDHTWIVAFILFWTFIVYDMEKFQFSCWIRDLHVNVFVQVFVCFSKINKNKPWWCSTLVSCKFI